MSTCIERTHARGELYVLCPRGHETHIAFIDRPVAAGDVLDADELRAVQAFTWAGSAPAEVGTISDVRCPTCAARLHGQSVQGRTLVDA